LRKLCILVVIAVLLFGVVACGSDTDVTELADTTENIQSETNELSDQDGTEPEYIGYTVAEYEESAMPEIILVPSDMRPLDLTLVSNFEEAEDVVFYNVPNIIYTTTARENGLADTFMFKEGTVISFENLVDTKFVIVQTTDGFIALSLMPLISDVLIELFEEGQEAGFFFMYMGYSAVFDMPTGMFVGLASEGELASEQEPEAEPEPDEVTASALEGTWLWMHAPYYVFNANGHGTMVGNDIRWAARNGVLSICNTPDECGNTCLAPMEWNYIISGDQLTLSSLLVPGMEYTYVRR